MPTCATQETRAKTPTTKKLSATNKRPKGVDNPGKQNSLQPQKEIDLVTIIPKKMKSFVKKLRKSCLEKIYVETHHNYSNLYYFLYAEFLSCLNL